MADEFDSTSPISSRYSFHPWNFREIIQRQVEFTSERQADLLSNFSIGNFDGRFLRNFPGETQSLQNAHGAPYHVVGVSRGGDISVAAP